MVPRFFLHITDREQSIPDAEGIECDGVATARKEALRTIAELVDSGLWAPNSHSGRLITIVDERGGLVETVALWEITSRLAGE